MDYRDYANKLLREAEEIAVEADGDRPAVIAEFFRFMSAQALLTAEAYRNQPGGGDNHKSSL